MTSKNLVAPWVRRFLLEHIVADLNLSRNTQASYRDAMTLLLPFAHLAPDVVRRFLAHLEDERHCAVSTRNQRLAAIHAFARFIGTRSPEHLAWCAELTAIPIKKAAKGTLPYLEKPEMDALLAAPGRRTSQGARDHALLLFLYNAGARADEAARLTVADLDLGTSPAAKLLGKGNKTRLCPLWPSTAGVLKTLVATRGGHEPVFLNRRREAITRFGIYDLVKRHAARAAQRVPSIAAKRVSPRVIRHTRAVHLLHAGVDIDTIDGVKENRAMGLAGRGQGGDADSTRYNR